MDAPPLGSPNAAALDDRTGMDDAVSSATTGAEPPKFGFTVPDSDPPPAIAPATPGVPDGKRTRVPRWIAERFLVGTFVTRYLYRGLRTTD